MRDGSGMTWLTWQRAEEIALGQVMCAPIRVARSLVRTKLCQGIGSNYRMTNDRAGNIGNMFAHQIDHSLGKTFGEIIRPGSITYLDHLCAITTWVTGNF